jgi:hypothetical protein
MKTNIGTITQHLLHAFGNKPMTIRTESNALIIKANGIETRFVNWENTPVDDIVQSTRATFSESTDSRVLLRG